MDSPNTTLSHGNSNRRRLTKKPPTSHSHNSSISADGRVDTQSLTSKRSSRSLRRAPSAPAPAPPSRSLSSNASNNSSPRFPTAPPTSSSSRSHPSPILPGSEFAATGPFSPQSQSQSQSQYSQPPTLSSLHNISSSAGPIAARTDQPLSSKTSDELIGAPFDGTAILSRIEATKSPAHTLHHPPPPPRPAPPPPLHTTSDARSMGPPPPLQQSSSFSKVELPSMSEKPPTARMDSSSTSKRYSDESKESKVPGMLRKKSGFSGFMSGLVGSPKKPLISAPENPVHVTHVGYDSTTGQFTVRLFSLFLTL